MGSDILALQQQGKSCFYLFKFNSYNLYVALSFAYNGTTKYAENIARRLGLARASPLGRGN